MAFALQRDRRQPAPDDFRDQLRSYWALRQRPWSSRSAFLPAQRLARPEIALLGSSMQSAIWGPNWACRYVFADFINPQGVPMAATTLRLHARRSS